MRRLAPLLVAGLALTGVLSGCGTPPLGGTAGKSAAMLTAAVLPETLRGLNVTAEPIAGVVRGLQHTYLDGLGFYGLRSGHRLEATVEIARFTPSPRLGQAAFRSQILSSLSPGIPVVVDVAGIPVQQSSGLKSTVSAWFRGRYLMVVTVLQSYPDPRGLLEATVRDVHPT